MKVENNHFVYMWKTVHCS